MNQFSSAFKLLFLLLVSDSAQQSPGPSPAPAPATPVPPISTDSSEFAILRAASAASWSPYVGSDPCQPQTKWPGISCSSSSTHYHISGILLSNDTPRALATLLSLASQLKHLRSLQILHTSSSSSSSSSSPSATIPESLAQLQQLQQLDLSNNGLHLAGSIPDQLANLTDLQRLILAGNQLNGPIPDSLCKLSSLEYFDLSRNHLQGAVPSCLSSLSALQLIDLGTNHLLDRIPDELGLFPNLLHLNLENNQLQGEIPKSVLALTSLQTLRCGRNLLQGPLPDQLGELGSLLVLDFSFNAGITGTIPSSVGDITGLQEIRLFSTGVNGSIPSEIGKLQNLTQLLLHSNLISGTIPDSVSQLSKLRLLQLQGNKLSGPLPGSIFRNLSSLEGLYLQSNSFTGPFPVEITGIRSLSVLNLGFNQLEGELPEDLGSMVNLEWLLLSGNRFSGQIPSSIGKLPKLQLLDLSSNLLNGPVPETENHIQVDFQFNRLNSSPALLHDLCFQTPCLNSEEEEEAVADSFAINAGGSEHNPSSASADHLSFKGDNVHVNASVAFVLTQPVCSSASASWGVAVTGAPGSSKIISTTSPINVSGSIGVELSFVAANPEIYSTARVGGDSISYHARCIRPGNYRVQLHFVELDENINSPGRRVFDVLIQNTPVEERLDVVKLTKVPFVALVQEYEAQVDENSSLKIELRGTGSWNTSDSYNGPIISALRVFANTSSSRTSSSGSSGNKSRELWAILGGSIGILAVVCVGMFVGLTCWLRRAERRMNPSGAAARPEDHLEDLMHNSLNLNSQIGSLASFEYSELLLATEKFCGQNLIGQGAYGKVFRGVLPDGEIVAIKQLVHRTPTCQKWFLHELQVISSVRHRNLVPLIGCCIDRGFPLLVCEFMPNGSLQDALFAKGGSHIFLPWERRYQIAMDVARGLQYLHDDCGRVKIIHRDVKPGNILLDKELRAHISDFGLAKLMDHHGDEIVVSSVMGTRGYLAPEYVLSGQLSEKVDVYSYGIVLLELVSGRRGMQSSMNLSSLEPVSIDEWAWEALVSQKIEALADPRLGNGYAADEMVRIVQIAMWCTQGLPEWRPGMGQVMQMLSDQIKVPELPSERSSWDDFKDVLVSGTFTSSSIWETVNDQSFVSGYETANATTLPDPISHEKESSQQKEKPSQVAAPPPSRCSEA